MARIIGGTPATTTTTGGGGLTPIYAPLSSATLSIGAGSNIADTAAALAVTGRRFLWDLWYPTITANTTVGGGVGWTGTALAARGYIEYSRYSTGEGAEILARSGTVSTPPSGSAQAPTANTTSGFLMVITQRTVSAASQIHATGVLEYASSGTYTLTPYLYSSAATPIYDRLFSVTVLA
jgi:hypothetical protein